jgi:HlyD family secretion protein
MLKRLDVAEVLASEDRRSRTRRFVRWAAVGVVVVAAAAGIFWGWRTWQASAVPTYATDTATRGDLTVSLVATGTVEPTHSIGVSSLINGTILSVDVNYNDTVRVGQPLAHIDPVDYEAKRKHALATVDAQAANRDAAETAVTDAEAALRRAQHLPVGEVVTNKDLELATTGLDRARANLMAANAELRMAEADLSGAVSDYQKTTIVSPIDGTVLDVNAQPGQTVSTVLVTTPLFYLATDLKSVEVDVDVDEADVTQVKLGDSARFTVEAAPDKSIAGTVSQVRQSPKVSDGVTSYTAVIAVDNSTGALRPGMTATASIETDHATGVLTVANAALRFLPKGEAAAPQGQQRVFVLRDGVTRPVAVLTGLTDGTRTVIVSGDLKAGEAVVTGVKDH